MDMVITFSAENRVWRHLEGCLLVICRKVSIIGSHCFFLLLATLIILSTISTTAAPFFIQKAAADGVAEENLSPEIIQGRQLSLFVKINPTIMMTMNQSPAAKPINGTENDSSNNNSTFLQFRLFDFKTNETVKFPTLHVMVSKGPNPNALPVLDDSFQGSMSGILTLDIRPKEVSQIEIMGSRDSVFNAVRSDSERRINISGPLLLDGGIYHVTVKVLGMNTPEKALPQENVKTFETFLSIGSVTQRDVRAQDGKTYPISITSYYDKVNHVRFDAISNNYTWSMPFDWNALRIQTASEIFVHEEVKIPKSFAGVGDVNAFNATIDGKPVTARMLIVDPYSDEKNLIIHFFLDDAELIAMAESKNNSSPNDNSIIIFSFKPLHNTSAETSHEVKTNATNGFHVQLIWYPRQVLANYTTVLELRFLEPLDRANVVFDGDVKYDLKISDKDGKNISNVVDKIAKSGKSYHFLSFPTGGIYHVEVTIKALIKKGQSVNDYSRNGIARGTVVVYSP
jgi:hypothetical protein